MIQHAFGWDDDHLYAFFMSGVAYDEYSEIGSPWSDTRRHTHQVQIGSLKLKTGDALLYLFDFGDQHEFDVRVMHVDVLAPKGTYPRLRTQQGQSPPQYVYDETSHYRSSRSP